MDIGTSNDSPVCENHGTQMILTPVGPTCLKCVREKVDEENREFSRKATLQAELSETYDVLKRRSLLSDETLIDATLDNFSVECEEQRGNLEKARIITKRVLEGESIKVWLVGEAGRGKSHVAMALLREFNEAGKRRIIAAQNAGEKTLKGLGTTSLFIDFDQMLRLIRKSYKDKDSEFTEDYFVSLCSKVDFLAIDDLGAETGAISADKQATDFVHKILYAISNARVNKTTIITTNLYKGQREEMYDSKILSRLSKRMAMIGFKESPDMRAEEFSW